MVPVGWVMVRTCEIIHEIKHALKMCFQKKILLSVCIACIKPIIWLPTKNIALHIKYIVVLTCSSIVYLQFVTYMLCIIMVSRCGTPHTGSCGHVLCDEIRLPW